ncbi:hypothetical protein LPJ66_003177 [Kickxella alabastrina]|uniref:Uncharacterized protein n=1 Tax=Kickxella alabastrina TaxID=61397 RepID=A0ACC1INC9_9FUNG|nr:hypothetical protein LPJ66_003177 [Kickxella alabastrina]
MLAKRPHEDCSSGSSPKKQRLECAIYPADDNDISSIVGRKRSIEDTENDPPYKKGKAHETPTDEDAPDQPPDNNNIPQPAGESMEAVNNDDAKMDSVNHLPNFVTTQRPSTPVQENDAQEPENSVDADEWTGPSAVHLPLTSPLRLPFLGPTRGLSSNAQSPLPSPSSGPLFICSSTEPLPPPGLALNQTGSPPSPISSFIRSSTAPLPSPGSTFGCPSAEESPLLGPALAQAFSPPSPGPFYERCNTEPPPSPGHALGHTYSPLSPGPSFDRSSSEPLSSFDPAYGHASNVQSPLPENADDFEQANNAIVEVDVPPWLPTEELNPAYRDEMLRKELKDFTDFEPKVVNLAEPEVAAYRERAAVVAGNVCKAMQYFRISSILQESVPMLASLIRSDSTQAIEFTHSAYNDVLGLAFRLEKDCNLFSDWAGTEAFGNVAGAGADWFFEESIISGAEAITMFVARLLKGFNHHAKGEHGRPEPRRLLFPSLAIDFKELDDQGNGRLVIGLEAKSITDVLANGSKAAFSLDSDYAEVSDEWYAGLFAAIEVRPGMSDSDEEDAKFHLAKRSRNIYRTQPNRRFLWGLTICGKSVRAYLFGPNFVLDSEDLNMDISTEAGCNEVVKLFVNLSFAEDYRLGYDPTIKRLHDLNCWKITAPCNADDGSSTGSCTYYSNKVLEADDHIIGSHKRRFLATKKMPTPDEPIRDKDCTVVVHDMWSELLRPVRENFCDEDISDELYILRYINDDFWGRIDLNGTYPVLAECGIARFECGSQHKPTDDTNYGILGNIYDEPSIPLGAPIPGCVHRRYVTGPIGSPLTEITSAEDMVAVAMDIMETCRQMYATSKHIHLNMSPDTIRFRRLNNGRIKGMIWGFNGLANRGKTSAESASERVGPPHFMSVNAVELNSNPLTELDEWESLIYIMHSVVLHSWKRFAKTETETDARIDTELDDNLAYLKRWDEKVKSFDSSAKRECLDNSANFSRYLNTLDDTIPGCKIIKDLLNDLRGALIESNCYHKDAVGALIREGEYMEPDPFSEDPVDLSPMVDPFRIRADWAPYIAARLRAILDHYAANLTQWSHPKN